MWSSGTAERRRTAHFTVVARWGNSTTSGPASHSTSVSAPTGELYVVHCTCMRISGARVPRSKVARGVHPANRIAPSTGCGSRLGSDATTRLSLDLIHDLLAVAGCPHLHRSGRR